MSGWGVFFTGVSAIAAVVSVVSAMKATETEVRLNEQMQVVVALSEWKNSLNLTGGHCAEMLSQFTPSQFREYANRANNELQPEQKIFLSRCTVEYNGTFDPEGDLIITEKERSYLSKQVLLQLNTYEALALHWDTLGETAKSTICSQAGIDKYSPYRSFQKIAEGTEWWNYPKLEIFMDKCEV